LEVSDVISDNENQLVKAEADVEVKGYSAGVVPCVGSDSGLHLALLVQ